MRIPAPTQAHLTVTLADDEKRQEFKTVDSKNIFQLEPYLENIQKNTATTIDLSEKKDPRHQCQKDVKIQDPILGWYSKESLFGKDYVAERKDISDQNRDQYDKSGVFQLGLMPNGHVVSLSRAGVIRVWDASTGECTKHLNLGLLDFKLGESIWGHTESYSCLTILSNGQIATALEPRHGGSSDSSVTKRPRTIDIWDMDVAKKVSQLKSKDYSDLQAGVLCLKGLPDDQLLVLGIIGFEIWDVKKQKILYSIERKHLGQTSPSKVKADLFAIHGALQILPNGNILGYQGGTIDVWDKTKKNLKQIMTYDISDKLALKVYPMTVLHDGRIAIPQWIPILAASYGSSWRDLGPDKRCDSIDRKSFETFYKKEGRKDGQGFLLCIGIYDHECRHITNFGPIEFYYDYNIAPLVQLLTLRNGHLLSVTAEKRIQIWNTTTGNCINTLEYPGGIIEKRQDYDVITVAELPEGRLVTGCHSQLSGKNADRFMRYWASGGPLQLRTIEPLLTALKTNTSVTILNLQNTAVDDNIIPFIVELWKTNYTLKKIDLRNTAVTVDGIRKIFQLTQQQVSLAALTAGSASDRKQNNSGLLELIQHPAIEVIKAEKREVEIKAKAKAEADERERKEAEIKAKAAAEAAEKARQAAEIKAKTEAVERAYKEEQAKIKAQAEAAEKLRKEQELKAQQEAEEKRRQEEKQKQLQELHKKGEQGDIAAQLDLAIRYEKGNDVAKDLQLALSWYKKAAEQGNDIAQQKLGEIFEKGLVGKKDWAQAYRWYQEGANNGNVEACAGLKRLKDIGYSPPPSTEFKATPTADKSPVGPTSSITKEARTEAKDDMSSAVSFEINYDQLTLGKELGRGGFGVVYQGTWRFNNVAIKQLLTKSLSAEALEEFNSESRIMAQLRSEYVVQFYGRCVSPTYCLVMQYMPKGSLFNLLRSSEPLDWSVRHRMITEIASGLAFLHASNIFHRDLKSLNVLLDEHYRTKLCDFGLSKVKKENQSTATLGGPVGTIPWMAPELFERRATFTAKADIYSLAMTLWEIASRKTPFADASSASLIPMWVAQGQREEIPSDTPLKISSLIRCCWHQDPTKRPTAAEVVTYLRSDQTEFKSTEIALSSPVTTSIQGNLASSAGSHLGSESVRANLMSVSI